jgi:hypothetical protein
VKQRKLRDYVIQVTEESARQDAAIRRELTALKQQVGSGAHPAAANLDKPAAVEVRTPVVATPQRPHFEEPVASVPEKKPDLPPPPKKEEPIRITLPPPVAIPPLNVPLQKSPSVASIEVPLVQPKPQATAEAPPATLETKPPAPVVQPPAPKIPLTPPPEAPTTPKTVASVPTPIPPAAIPAATIPSVTIPPVTTARVSSRPPVAAMRVSAPRPTLQQRMKAVSALEQTLGTNWLNKLGIIILVVGVALFGIYELGTLGPLGKAGISFAASFGLLAGGIFLESREQYRLIGRGGIGGGWALLFFSSYAIHHVGAMRALSSEVIDLILMLVVAVAMAVHTLRYRSQFVTGLAFLLGYTTVALNHDTVYSLSAGVVLAIGLVSIVLKMGWYELEVFGILSSYLNHLYWLYRILGIEGAHGRAFEAYNASTAMLFFYWLVFRVSYALRKIKTNSEEHVSTAAAVLNTFLLLGTLKFQSVHPELAYVALLVVGAFEFTFGQLPRVKKRREAFVVLSAMGAALMLAAPSRYSGNNVAILWLAGTEVFLIAGIAVKEVVFRRLGLFTGVLVGVHIIGVDFRQLVELRLSGEPFALALGVLFALCAVVLYGNSLAIGSRWREFFENTLDRRLLAAHSYIGALLAPAAAWALLAKDWTALAFAAIMLVVAAFGRKLKSTHLHVQYGFLGALTLYRALIVNLHTGSPAHVHIMMRLLSLPLLAAAFYLTAKLADLPRAKEQCLFRGALASTGTLLFTLLLVYEVPELWQPLAFIAFAVVLSEAGRKLGYAALALHTHALTILAFFQALTDDNGATYQWHTLPVRAFAALPVVTGAYWLAWYPAVTNPRHLQIARGLYTWAAAGLLTWILSDLPRAPWIVVGWMVLGILLVLATRWIRYRQLAWQAHAVALCVFVRAYMINLGVEQQFWKGVSLRLVTTGLVIGGAYVLATIDTKIVGAMQAAVRNVHTWAAAFFVGYLIWLEAQQPWIAVGFLGAGLLLALAGRRWNLAHLSYQEHLFAIAAVYRGLTFNYELQTAYGHFSVRLITISLVAAGLYGISRMAAPREAIYGRAAAYLHTTAATGMLAFLMWYEASTGWLAALWSVFALVLAAVDRRFHLEDLRWQAHALAAITLLRSLGISVHTAETWRGLSVRLLSLSIVAVVFYAMSRLIRMPEEWRARDFHHIYSWAASTLVSLLSWYELQPLSVALGWGVFGLVLFEYGLLRKIGQFRYQAYLALVAAFTRIFFANLTAGEPGQFWSPRMTNDSPAGADFLFHLRTVAGKGSRRCAGSAFPL